MKGAQRTGMAAGIRFENPQRSVEINGNKSDCRQESQRPAAEVANRREGNRDISFSVGGITGRRTGFWELSPSGLQEPGTTLKQRSEADVSLVRLGIAIQVKTGRTLCNATTSP